MTEIIASSIFWGTIAAFAFVIYYSAVLPGIRQSLRYDVFRLRDELRKLVMEGVIKEQDVRFTLLQDKLNFMSNTLNRFDLLASIAAVKSIEAMSSEEKKRFDEYLRLMDESPESLKKIYHDSVVVFVKAVAFNSIFTLVLITLAVLVATAVRVGFVPLKDALKRQAILDSQLAFFNASSAAIDHT